MVSSHHPHHLHVRKRIHENFEEYPHPNKWKRYLDKIIYAVGVSGPIMTLPQVYNIWILKETAGVSRISWTWYMGTSFIWIIYGAAHKDKPIMITYSIWAFIEVLIVIGLWTI